MRFSLFLLSLLFLSANAQDAEVHLTSVSKDHDTNYIETFEDQLILKTYLIEKSNSVLLSQKSKAYDVELEPNGVTKLGFGFNYKSLGLSVAFVPMNKRNESKYGSTSSLDIQGNIFTRKFGFDVRAQVYSGFYLANIYSIDPDYPLDTALPTRPDITTVSLAGSAFYVFNHDKFSFRSIYANNERQLKRAGTWYAGMTYALFGIFGDSSIAYNADGSPIDPSQYFSAASFLSMGVFGGYAYNLVIKRKGFIALGLGPGLSAIRIRLIDGNDNLASEGWRPALTGSFQLAGGFNSDRFFAGLTLTNNSSGFAYNHGEGRLDFNSGSLRIYAGIRFL